MTPIGAAERKTILGFNPAAGCPPQAPVHESICTQAARTPDAIAMRDGAENYTYRQLLDAAALTAGRLNADGIGPGAVVGVCTERSGGMVVSILGVLLAGAAYLPLDPAYPRSRLDLMIKIAGARTVMASDEAAGAVAGAGGASVRTLAGLPRGGTTAWREPPRPVAWPGYKAPPEVADGLCYTIFTSGSTGAPKGVQLPHRSLANRLAWMQDEYRLGCHEVVLHKTPHTFDVSVWELLWAFLAGACLVVAAPDAHRDPRELVRLIVAEHVTTIHFVPSMLALFAAEEGLARCTSLRRIICSGEVLPPKLVNRVTAILPEVTVYNLYGPTEAAIDVTSWRCRRPEPEAGVPIGRPIANVVAYVLDEHGELAPIGVPGELAVGGACLARGYADRPDLSAERFVITHVGGRPERVYRTGDLAWWSPDGCLQYAGRLDGQVKIRGQRVELGEIESVLNRHPFVVNSAVALRDDLGTAPVLVAYLVPSGAAGVDTSRAGEAALRAYVASYLPEYMVPLRYVALTGLPATANGKADRSALPAPPPRIRRRAAS